MGAEESLNDALSGHLAARTLAADFVPGVLGLSAATAAQAARCWFDLLVLMLTLVVALLCAVLGFHVVELPVADAFGRRGGAIWQQVLPALYGYGAFTAVLVLAMLLRHAGLAAPPRILICGS